MCLDLRGYALNYLSKFMDEENNLDIYPLAPTKPTKPPILEKTEGLGAKKDLYVWVEPPTEPTKPIFGDSPRSSLLAIVDSAMKVGAANLKNRKAGQINIFGNDEQSDPPIPYIPDTVEQCLAWEKELLGFYVSGHPLDAYSAWTESSFLSIAELEEEGIGKLTHFCGLIDSVDVRTDKRGQPWAKVVISDRTGEVEVLCFKGAYSNYREFLKPNNLVTVTGRLKKDDFRSHFAKAEEDVRYVFWAEGWGGLAEYAGDLRRGAESYSVGVHGDWKRKRKEELKRRIL